MCRVGFVADKVEGGRPVLQVRFAALAFTSRSVLVKQARLVGTLDAALRGRPIADPR